MTGPITVEDSITEIRELVRDMNLTGRASPASISALTLIANCLAALDSRTSWAPAVVHGDCHDCGRPMYWSGPRQAYLHDHSARRDCDSDDAVPAMPMPVAAAFPVPGNNFVDKDGRIRGVCGLAAATVDGVHGVRVTYLDSGDEFYPDPGPDSDQDVHTDSRLPRDHVVITERRGFSG